MERGNWLINVSASQHVSAPHDALLLVPLHRRSAAAAVRAPPRLIPSNKNHFIILDAKLFKSFWKI